MHFYYASRATKIQLVDNTVYTNTRKNIWTTLSWRWRIALAHGVHGSILWSGILREASCQCTLITPCTVVRTTFIAIASSHDFHLLL